MAKNLGKVTAYAHAKAGGYTGTEAEFNAMLAGLEGYADAAAESAEEASGYAEEASGYVTEASGYADNASASASAALEILGRLHGSERARYWKHYDVTTQTTDFAFNPTNYSYTTGDDYDVYVNGEMLNRDKVMIHTASYGGGYNVTIIIDGGISGAGNPDEVDIFCYKNITLSTDDTLTEQGAAADAKKTGDEIDALKDDLNELLIPLELVATYDGKILRKTGMQDNADYAVYQYLIPDNVLSVHIKTNFYGNVFIIFTDMATDGDFSASPYQQYPSSGYPTPTTVDDDYDTKEFKYVWIPLYKKSGITASAKYSAFELIDNNKQGVDDLNAKVTENKRDIVALQADVDDLKGLMKYPGSFNMEIGNISLYGYNDLRYTSSTSRVRTLQGGNIHMKQGYKVTLSDYTTHRYFLFQIVSSERVNALGWKQEDFVVTDEADYAIIISALPEATVTDIAELASLMTIYPTKDEEDESGIPTYWDNEINTSIATIQSNELEAGNRIFEFIFLTDTHWSHNAKNSPAIVEFLSDKFHINQIFGGDVVTSHYENKASAISEIREFYNAFTKPIPTVLGNHDFNAANDTTQRLTMAECYALMIRQQENVLGMDTFASPYYWTLDNESQKVRIIGFRCDGINAVSSDITNKVKELISTLSAEWNVILLTHGFWAVTSAGDPISIATPVQAVIDGIMPTIESAIASVPLWVVGHSHRDQSQVITGTNKSVLVLGCNCDAYSESAVWGGETMTQGTATEQAITCIQLDMTNKKVHAVRIGAGSDRTFSY